MHSTYKTNLFQVVRNICINKKNAISVKYPVCNSDCKTWWKYAAASSRERKRRSEQFFCTACHFAGFHSQIPRRHFLDSMSREQPADMSIAPIVANLQEKKREREEKRAKEPCSELPCATKNTPAMEYRLTTARSAGYFVLSWKSNVHRCARCVLGTSVHEYQAAVLLSDNETDI